MDADTERYSLDRYWRRRVAVLAGMVCAVGALAWACAGGSSGGDEKVAGAIDSAAPVDPPTAVPTVTVTVTPEPAQYGGPCRPRDLVLTMAAAKAYTAGQSPRFRITAVNTSAASCRFDTGALSVVVTSGKDRIWSSGECRKGRPEKRTLRRGVPYTAAVTWDRRRGCTGPPARPGTYVAALKGGKASKRIFHLR
ncbi:hypothetical protein F8568_017345 [Actinomadura sp. LD22]|uniref:DUF4232 domain-containing protein n=1 Tax=Actinomadura physcomitrii TaxID=2650748 RepID=A0A6I4MIQ4_9ACTN|nr:hypothetical protein [Actinomadura physcomitrii]MWA02106.1 hypothetical protein [Actinomadura physcomitrii]